MEEENSKEKLPFVSMGEARRVLSHYKETIASLKEENARLKETIDYIRSQCPMRMQNAKERFAK